MNDIAEWLEGLGLGEYAEAFAENRIDLGVLPRLTGNDLKEIGVIAVGDRRRLLDAIALLTKQDPQSDDEGTPAAGTPGDQRTEAERRQLTVMFCDLVGSTALSQRLDPEDLRDLMRRYQDAVAGAVTRYGGHVAKYLGDGVLAYFGWPQAYEDQAERAVRAGLAAVRSVGILQGDGDNRLQARVGIDTGQVVVGDLIGEIGRDAEAVSGETPNLAARLQQVAEPGQVVIGAVTRLLIGQAFVGKDLGDRELKGFAEPVQVWRITGEVGSDSRFEALHGGSITSLFGRKPELDLLLDRWAQAKSDGGQVVILSGEAGIGKSRLVQALREHVASEQCFRLRYQCSPYHANSAFFPIISRLERTARFSEEDSADEKLDKLEDLLRLSQTDIEAVAPFFAMLMSLPVNERYGTQSLEPQQIRERTFEALIGQVLDLARQRPVFFVLEDAHWVDPTTESWVGRLMDRIADAPVFMLITHRLEYAPPWARDTRLTSMTLNRLSREQAARIVHAIAGEELPAAVAGRVVARADGVPLYLEELTKSMLEAGAGAGSAGADDAIPATLQASLSARLDRLGKAKEIAQVGAVIGRKFSDQLVTTLAEMPESEVHANLERLVESGLVFQRGTPPDATYIFKHALIQDAAYDSLLLSHRRLLHGNVVTTIEQLFRGNLDDHAELLAFHAQRGELWEKALDFCRLAGRKANERSAYDEALSFLETGLKVAERVPENEDTLRTVIDIRLSMRPSLGAFGRYNHFLDVLSEAESAAQRLGDKYTTTHISVEKTHVLYQTGNVSDGVEVGRKAVEMARDIDHRRLIVGAAANLGMALFFRGDLREAVRVAIEHVDDLQNEFRHDQLGTTGTSSVNWLANLAAMHAMLGKLDTAKRFGEEAARIAEETDKPFDIAMAGHWNGFVSISMDDLPNAFQCLERAFQLVEDHGLNFLYPFGGMHLGTACALSGQHERAETLLMSAADKADQLGLVLANIWAVVLMAEAKILAGVPEAALEYASNALKLAKAHGFRWLQVLALHHLGRGNALLGGPRIAEAEDCWLQAINLAKQLEARLFLADAEHGLGEMFALTDRIAEAKKHLGRASDLYQLMDLPSRKRETMAILDQVA